MVSTKPFGVPQVVSYMFWTGLWGVLAAFLVPRLMARWLGWVLFAAVVVTLASWFIVLPLKGSPVEGGFRMPGAVVAPLVYGFWGFGMWLIYSALQKTLGHRRRQPVEAAPAISLVAPAARGWSAALLCSALEGLLGWLHQGAAA